MTAKKQKPVDRVIPKEPLAKEVARIIKERSLTQTEAAYLIKDAPSQVSLIVTGKVAGFSADRLIRTLSRLGRDVDIVIRKTKGAKSGRVRLTLG